MLLSNPIHYRNFVIRKFEMKEKLKERYQFVFEEALLDEMVRIGIPKHFKKGISLMEIGDRLEYMPLVIEGAIRIMGEDEKSNEILLYYLETGDSCAMTMSCCMGNRKSSIRALAEQDTSLIMIPIRMMEEWIIKYRTWRAFVFESYDTRMSELLEAIDALAFHNMEERLYKYLRDKAMVLRSHQIEITHYQIANDLNTSRVVVSRLMKKLNLDGKITYNRNQVEIREFAPKK